MLPHILSPFSFVTIPIETKTIFFMGKYLSCVELELAASH
jgi:hypothetical protein